MTTKQQLLKIQREEHDYNFCMKCKFPSPPAFKLELHHIIFRSEKPNHKELNNPRNLILLCSEMDRDKCHKYYHDKKSRREHLINERNLTQLFGANILTIKK